MVAVLDTNIIVDLLRNRGESPAKILAYTDLCIPGTVVGELLYGADISAKPAENRRDVLSFTSKCRLLEHDFSVFDAYARIRKYLKEKGRPIPENDIWIAAAALAFDMKLITKDPHFAQIDFLSFEFWNYPPFAASKKHWNTSSSCSKMESRCGID